MIRRFDLRKNENGNWQLNEVVTDNEQPKELKNWILEIKKDKLIVVGLSNANKNKDRIISYPLKEGSLFLYNSTYNWYSYFREKEIQNTFDKYKIIKCVHVYKSTFLLHFIINDGIVNNPITHISGFNPVKIYKSEFESVDENGVKKSYAQILFELKEGEKGLIVQKGKNSDSNIIYISDSISLYDLDWEMGAISEINDFNQYMEEIDQK